MSSIWRRHTSFILVGGVVLLILASAVSFLLVTAQPKTSVQIGSGSFSVRLAVTDADLMRGLSGVSELKPSDGLLMDFKEEGVLGIWMKDMKIPIDIIWMNEAREVVYIVKNAPPELGTTQTYKNDKPARFVLELAAGSVQSNAIKLGEKAVFVIPEDTE